jgi:hypothetical protein
MNEYMMLAFTKLRSESVAERTDVASSNDPTGLKIDQKKNANYPAFLGG